MNALKPLWKDFAYTPHQIYGVNWLLQREKEKGESKGGCLCDEMGLGKTIQMLGLINESPNSSTLMVVPLAVANQWKDSAIRCRINTMVFAEHSWKLKSPPFPYRPTIYIIGYEALANNISTVSVIHFDRLICDEAHRLGVKNIRGLLARNKPVKKIGYKTIMQVKAESKWFLTATPVVNSQDDVLTLFALLDKRLNTLPIAELMEKYVLARTMAQLRTSISDAPLIPIIQTHKLDFSSKEEEEFYVSIQTNIKKQLSYNEGALVILRLIMLLRQLSIHPQVYIGARQRKYKKSLPQPDWTVPSTKFLKMKQLMEEEKGEPHKWIIFCQFHDEMMLLKSYLSTLKFIRHIETYSGTLSIEEKAKAIEKVSAPFNGDTCDVLLLQLKAGGVGLNLQVFDRIIFNSPWWTQAAIEQGIGRAVRIGQTKQVVVHNLVLKQEEVNSVRNIDTWMRRIAEEKSVMNEIVLNMANNSLQTSLQPTR